MVNCVQLGDANGYVKICEDLTIEINYKGSIAEMTNLARYYDNLITTLHAQLVRKYNECIASASNPEQECAELQNAMQIINKLANILNMFRLT